MSDQNLIEAVLSARVAWTKLTTEWRVYVGEEGGEDYEIDAEYLPRYFWTAMERLQAVKLEDA